MAKTNAAARIMPPCWLFEASRYQPVKLALLADAGLPWEPLARVQLSLVRAGRAGTWHLAPTSAAAGPAGGCPRLRRAADRGRPLDERQAGILAGTRLCAWCAARLTVPGPEGAYLALARYVLAARDWVTALEDAAPTADWLTYARWTARTPFTDPAIMPALIGALPGEQAWASCRAAAEAAWQHLAERARSGWERARQAAGPPGFRALTATACALTWANPSTRAESQLLAAITAGPERPPSWGGEAWALASAAWLDAVALDADAAAGEVALLAAIDDLYADIPVRDVTLLPIPAAGPPWPFSSPADWAAAELGELVREVAGLWCQRLGGNLALLESQDDDDWLLLRVEGWPLTDQADRDLAYLAAYPELGREPDPDCGPACGRSHPSWAVVLHVPGFAALHAAIHDGAHLDTIAGPRIPAGTQPDPAQVRALLPGAASAKLARTSDLR